MRHLRWLIAAAAILASGVSRSAGYFVPGYSVSQIAMAGAATVMTEDALVASVNPANLVWLDDRFDFGLTELVPRRGYTATAPGSGAASGLVTVTPGSVDSHRSRFYVPGFGFKRSIDDRSAWGIALYANGGLNTTFDDGSVTFGQGEPLLQEKCQGYVGGGPVAGVPGLVQFCGERKASVMVDLEQVFIVPSYSRKLGEQASVGIEPVLAVQQFHATGLAAFARFSNDPDDVSDQGYARSFGGGARIGTLYAPFDWLSVGGSYQSRLLMTRLRRYQGTFAQRGSLDLPQNWNVGIGVAFGAGQKLDLDFQRIYFHQVRTMGNTLDGNAFVNHCVLPRLLGNTAPSSYCLGGEDGPGFGWRNTSAIKIGYQGRFGDWLFRLGYNHARTAIMQNQELFNALAAVTPENIFGAGISYRWSPRLSFDSALLYAPDKKLTGKNSLSNTSANIAQILLAGALPSGSLGTANAFGPDPNDQDITIHAQVYELSVGLTYHF